MIVMIIIIINITGSTSRCVRGRPKRREWLQQECRRLQWVNQQYLLCLDTMTMDIKREFVPLMLPPMQSLLPIWVEPPRQFPVRIYPLLDYLFPFWELVQLSFFSRYLFEWVGRTVLSRVQLWRRRFIRRSFFFLWNGLGDGSFTGYSFVWQWWK